MLKDVNYNLFHEIAEISKFLSRFETYMEDSSDCDSCQKTWKTIKDHREEELKMLLGVVKECVESGKVSADEQRAAA